MCDVITPTMIAIGASTAMGVASANLQIQGQKMQARMQAKMQEEAENVLRTNLQDARKRF